MITTIREKAIDYIPIEMGHVADLSEFSLNSVLYQQEKTNTKGEKYILNYIELNNKKYQVPNKVLELIQQILKLKPNISKVKIIKTGMGLATKYKIEVLD